MIKNALNIIAFNLNQYLKNKFKLTEDHVIVSNLVTLDGSIPKNIQNKIIISLVNIEQESIISNVGFTQYNNTLENNLPLHINLNVLISSNFENYEEGLHFISNTIIFFNNNPVYTKQNQPDYFESFEKLSIELFKTTIQETSQIWSSIGVKHSPSVLYKIRLL